MSEVVALRAAEAPAKADILRLLDRVRAQVESGNVLSLILIPIHPDKRWTTMSAGEVRMLELGGILGRAWMDAMEALSDLNGERS